MNETEREIKSVYSSRSRRISLRQIYARDDVNCISDFSVVVFLKYTSGFNGKQIEFISFEIEFERIVRVFHNEDFVISISRWLFFLQGISPSTNSKVVNEDQEHFIRASSFVSTCFFAFYGSINFDHDHDHISSYSEKC